MDSTNEHKGRRIALLEMILIVAAAAAGAGAVQSLTGFGGGIVMMMFFPSLLPVLSASSLSGAVGLLLSGSLMLRYRRYIRRDLLVLPAAAYIVSSTLSLTFADMIETGLLLKLFGAFLVVLSIYFLCFSGRLQVKATAGTATVCGALSGVVGGLFGIGGPPMVLYYLAAMEKKEEYLGTIQAFFFLTGAYTLAVRIFKGYYTLALALPTLVGVGAILLGMLIGNRLQDRINGAMMRKLVYAFLGVTGIINLLK